MSKSLIGAVAIGLMAVAAVPAMPNFAAAAELPLPAPTVRAHHAACWCGPCGCLHVTHVRHRELLTTYGIRFDPRNYDETEPHYYFGPVRAYARYWVEPDPVE